MNTNFWEHERKCPCGVCYIPFRERFLFCVSQCLLRCCWLLLIGQLCCRPSLKSSSSTRHCVSQHYSWGCRGFPHRLLPPSSVTVDDGQLPFTASHKTHAIFLFLLAILSCFPRMQITKKHPLTRTKAESVLCWRYKVMILSNLDPDSLCSCCHTKETQIRFQFIPKTNSLKWKCQI